MGWTPCEYMTLNALGMEETLLFPLAHCVLQCFREICDSFITTGLVFSPLCVSVQLEI